MCGRFARRGDKQKIAEAFQIRGSLDETDFEDTQDAAPGSVQPVVRMEHEERELTLMRWGFKLPDRLLFNTRSEGVAESRFWKDKLKYRCILPASSYFEWPDNAKAPKPKYEITVRGRSCIGIAGLWAPWKNPKTQEWEKTFSAFTVEPNELIKTIHFRQPAILEPRDYEEWLAPAERPPVHLLRILPEEEMKMELVSPIPQYPQGGLFDESS